MSEVRGPCGVENTEMRARELSVLDCLLMACSRSWELVGQALPLDGMAGKLPARRRLPLGENAYPTTLCTFPSSIEAIALKDVLNEDPNGIPAGNP